MQPYPAISSCLHAVIKMSRIVPSVCRHHRLFVEVHGAAMLVTIFVTILAAIPAQTPLLGGISAFFAVARPALAESERDWDDCNADDPDRSLAACTRILSGRSEKRRALAYYNRGYVYKIRGDLDRAIADYNKAIRLEPRAAAPYYERGVAYHARSDLDHAIADYDMAIRLDPHSAHAYRTRGLAYLYGGALAQALADVTRAGELDPKNAYNVLWVDIVGRRNHVAGRLPQAISRIDMTAWPAPVVLMFLGRMMPEAVRAAADDPDAGTRRGQVCEADFYGGEWALRQGAKDEAVRLFRLAAGDCPHDFEEWIAASAELRARGMSP